MCRSPCAIIGLAIAVAIIETLLWQKRGWFADEAAWYWQSKAEMIEDGQLEGDVAILGTSVSFHGLDPTRINAQTRSELRVVSLALNGLRLQHQAQTLRRYLESGNAPRWLILELREATVERDSWVSGPYWRFWATWPEFCESRFYYWEPSRAVDFFAHRVFASYAYRRAIDNWFFACVRGRHLEETYRARNIDIAQEMRSHKGFNKGGFTYCLQAGDVPEPQSRPFELNIAGDHWLRHILSLCRRHSIAVAILEPPTPDFVTEDRKRSGFDTQIDAYIRSLSLEFPDIWTGTIEPRGYDLTDFADDHHMSYRGADRLSSDVAHWVDQLNVEDCARTD